MCEGPTVDHREVFAISFSRDGNSPYLIAVPQNHVHFQPLNWRFSET